MHIYAAGADVTVTVDLVTHDGEQLTASAATYKVYDGAGAELTTGSLVIDGSEDQLELTVAAAHNAVAVGVLNEARTVVFTVVATEGTFTLKETYILEQFAFLSVPTQSGMTLQDAHVLALTTSQALSEVWTAAEDRERQGALVEAWSRVSKIRFNPWRDEDTPDETLSDDILNLDFRVNTLTSAEWALLPQHFRDACKRAQFVEAIIILDGDPTWDRRADGLLSKTVGESSEMFRPGKPAMHALSPKAMAEIGEYVARRIRIAR